MTASLDEQSKLRGHLKATFPLLTPAQIEAILSAIMTVIADFVPAAGPPVVNP